jgi:hypothetical protein
MPAAVKGLPRHCRSKFDNGKQGLGRALECHAPENSPVGSVKATAQVGSDVRPI